MTRRILVVDDNADNRNVLSRLLDFGGYLPEVAASARDAFALAEATPPDLVLMDLSMPDIDGWDATSRFKADERLHEIPVIAVTGHVTGEEIRRAQEVGCSDIVSKPIDYYVLMDKIRHHLGDAAA
ncbi:MAG: response regulator [Acidobacteriota bacterium]